MVDSCDDRKKVPRPQITSQNFNDSVDELNKMDIFVCGTCYYVSHFVEEFIAHKEEPCERTENIQPNTSDQKPQVWSFLLWKNAKHRANSQNSSWQLYQEWCSLPESIKDTWIQAGQFLKQSATIRTTNRRIGDGHIILDDEELSQMKAIVPNRPVPNSNKVMKKTRSGKYIDMVIDRILAKRIVNKKTEYWVKYKGRTSIEEKYWEPIEAMQTTCQDMIAQFENKYLSSDPSRKRTLSQSLESAGLLNNIVGNKQKMEHVKQWVQDDTSGRIHGEDGELAKKRLRTDEDNNEDYEEFFMKQSGGIIRRVDMKSCPASERTEALNKKKNNLAAEIGLESEEEEEDGGKENIFGRKNVPAVLKPNEQKHLPSFPPIRLPSRTSLRVRCKQNKQKTLNSPSETIVEVKATSPNPKQRKQVAPIRVRKKEVNSKDNVCEIQQERVVHSELESVYDQVECSLANMLQDTNARKGKTKATPSNGKIRMGTKTKRTNRSKVKAKPNSDIADGHHGIVDNIGEKVEETNNIVKTRTKVTKVKRGKLNKEKGYISNHDEIGNTEDKLDEEIIEILKRKEGNKRKTKTKAKCKNGNSRNCKSKTSNKNKQTNDIYGKEDIEDEIEPVRKVTKTQRKTKVLYVEKGMVQTTEHSAYETACIKRQGQRAKVSTISYIEMSQPKASRTRKSSPSDKPKISFDEFLKRTKQNSWQTLSGLSESSQSQESSPVGYKKDDESNTSENVQLLPVVCLDRDDAIMITHENIENVLEKNIKAIVPHAKLQDLEVTVVLDSCGTNDKPEAITDIKTQIPTHEIEPELQTEVVKASNESDAKSGTYSLQSNTVSSSVSSSETKITEISALSGIVKNIDELPLVCDNNIGKQTSASKETAENTQRNDIEPVTSTKIISKPKRGSTKESNSKRSETKTTKPKAARIPRNKKDTKKKKSENNANEHWVPRTEITDDFLSQLIDSTLADFNDIDAATLKLNSSETNTLISTTAITEDISNNVIVQQDKTLETVGEIGSEISNSVLSSDLSIVTSLNLANDIEESQYFPSEENNEKENESNSLLKVQDNLSHWLNIEREGRNISSTDLTSNSMSVPVQSMYNKTEIETSTLMELAPYKCESVVSQVSEHSEAEAQSKREQGEHKLTNDNEYVNAFCLDFLADANQGLVAPDENSTSSCETSSTRNDSSQNDMGFVNPRDQYLRIPMTPNSYSSLHPQTMYYNPRIPNYDPRNSGLKLPTLGHRFPVLNRPGKIKFVKKKNLSPQDSVPVSSPIPPPPSPSPIPYRYPYPPPSYLNYHPFPYRKIERNLSDPWGCDYPGEGIEPVKRPQKKRKRERKTALPPNRSYLSRFLADPNVTVLPESDTTSPLEDDSTTNVDIHEESCIPSICFEVNDSGELIRKDTIPETDSSLQDTFTSPDSLLPATSSDTCELNSLLNDPNVLIQWNGTPWNNTPMGGEVSSAVSFAFLTSDCDEVSTFYPKLCLQTDTLEHMGMYETEPEPVQVKQDVKKNNTSLVDDLFTQLETNQDTLQSEHEDINDSAKSLLLLSQNDKFVYVDCIEEQTRPDMPSLEFSP